MALARASAIGGRAVTLSDKSNNGNLLKLYCHVFSNVLWVCVNVSFWKRIPGLVKSKIEFQGGIISVVAKLRNCYSSQYSNFQRGICSDSEYYLQAPEAKASATRLDGQRIYRAEPSASDALKRARVHSKGRNKWRTANISVKMMVKSTALL